MKTPCLPPRIPWWSGQPGGHAHEGAAHCGDSRHLLQRRIDEERVAAHDPASRMPDWANTSPSQQMLARMSQGTGAILCSAASSVKIRATSSSPRIPHYLLAAMQNAGRPVPWLIRASICCEGEVFASPAFGLCGFMSGDSFSSIRRCSRCRESPHAQRLHARGHRVGQLHHGIRGGKHGVFIEFVPAINLSVVSNQIICSSAVSRVRGVPWGAT